MFGLGVRLCCRKDSPLFFDWFLFWLLHNIRYTAHSGGRLFFKKKKKPPTFFDVNCCLIAFALKRKARDGGASTSSPSWFRVRCPFDQPTDRQHSKSQHFGTEIFSPGPRLQDVTGDKNVFSFSHTNCLCVCEIHTHVRILFVWARISLVKESEEEVTLTHSNGIPFKVHSIQRFVVVWLIDRRPPPSPLDFCLT